MRTHYQLLDLEPSASAEEIKRAFRREIARYHPDKVQHLGLEFQEIAAVRAAELTEAYRVLMDEDARRKYDEGLEEGLPPTAAAPPKTTPHARSRPSDPPPPPRAPQQDPEAPPLADKRIDHERATTIDFVRKASIAKLRNAVTGLGGIAVAIPGFDAAFEMKPRKALFKKADPAVRLLARVVPTVDAGAIEETYPLAARAASFAGIVGVLLLGSGLAPTRDLSVAISDQRRKVRAGSLVLVPVDLRDWEALFPPETPDVIRQIIQRLRAGA